MTNFLLDSYGRLHTDLRVSVTDRCNLRCRYCMPEAGVEFRPHAAILAFEEIARFVRVAAGLGVRKVRLTGGEPLVRKGVVDLVRLLAALTIDDLALTTNGVLLSEMAGDLAAAGLARVNISLDTLDRRRFAEISGTDALPQVLAGIEAARAAGFRQIKLNTVAVRGQTETEAVPLVRYAMERGISLRFIELMPMDGQCRWSPGQVLPGREILAILSREIGPLRPVPMKKPLGAAVEYEFLDGGRIGVAPAVTAPFCGHCSRLRLTSEGQIRNCLFSPESWDARAVLRGSGGDDELAALLRAAVARKKERRGTDQGTLEPATRAMYQIGG